MFTAPTLLLLVVFAGVPENTSEKVPEVLGLYAAPPTQFAFKLHAWELAPLHDEIVPADAVQAVARPMRAPKATRTAAVPEKRVMDWNWGIGGRIKNPESLEFYRPATTRVNFFNRFSKDF